MKCKKCSGSGVITNKITKTPPRHIASQCSNCNGTGEFAINANKIKRIITPDDLLLSPNSSKRGKRIFLQFNSSNGRSVRFFHGIIRGVISATYLIVQGVIVMKFNSHMHHIKTYGTIIICDCEYAIISKNRCVSIGPGTQIIGLEE